MQDEASKEKNMGEIDLQKVWQLLTDDEKREFWTYAGQNARELSHRSRVFKSLCAALKEAESGRSGASLTNAYIEAVRPLSAEDLRLGVCRFKSRLLDQPTAQPFLIRAFCNWIQDVHRSALNAVLDAVKCPHDERGSLKGEVPPFASEAAEHGIGALVSVYSTHSLALVSLLQNPPLQLT
jgi:hypothetical protein